VCASGQLTVYGSTDFAPLLAEVAQAYERVCRGAQITVASAGDTHYAVVSLASGKAGSSVLVEAPGTYTVPSLVRRPLAIEMNSVIVNRATGIRSLTTAQIRGIYDGTVTNWRQLGGSDLPITTVGLGAGSATRLAFDQLILGVRESSSPGPCLGSPGHCTESSTLALLSLVNATPGAIGYASATAVASAGHSGFPRISQVSIDGVAPTAQNVLNGGYTFWQIASVYSLGIPPAGSVSASFTSYLGTSASQGILRAQGVVPCGNSTLCG
jgi:phosphate transport system substrate-binding protein